jgi:hypothetical protein
LRGVGGTFAILQGLGGTEGGSDNRTELACFRRIKAWPIHPIGDPRIDPEPMNFELPPCTQAASKVGGLI